MVLRSKACTSSSRLDSEGGLHQLLSLDRTSLSLRSQRLSRKYCRPTVTLPGRLEERVGALAVEFDLLNKDPLRHRPRPFVSPRYGPGSDVFRVDVRFVARPDVVFFAGSRVLALLRAADFLVATFGAAAFAVRIAVPIGEPNPVHASHPAPAL
jgi:hypothetical protein